MFLRRLFVLFIVSYSAAFQSLAMEDVFDQHIITVHKNQVVRYDAETPKGIILWVHGGPFADPLNESLKTRQKFFKDLVAAGFTVIAPTIPQNISGEAPKEYKEILNQTARWIQQEFPQKRVFLLSHSLGGHWAGQTLLDKDSPLSRVCDKWIILSGTTHHAVGDLRRYMKNPTTFMNKITMGEDESIWNPTSPLEYSSHNLNNLLAIRDFYTWKQSTASQMDTRYQIGVDYLTNPIFNEILDKELSLIYHIENLPPIPTLLVNPLYDMSVTVDTSARFVSLSRELNKNNIYFLTSTEGSHNWMTDSQAQTQEDAYTTFFPPIIQFLDTQNYDIFEVRTEDSLNQVKAHLHQYPALDYVSAFERFKSNEPTEFYYVFNDSTHKISPEKLSSSDIIQLNGIQKTKETFYTLNKIIETAFPPDFVTPETKTRVEETFQQCPGNQKRYFAALRGMIIQALSAQK